MTGLEWENFHKLDNEEYIIEKNKEFIKYYQEKKKNGYNPILTLTEIQTLINEITSFFEFKYPEKLLNQIEYENILGNEVLDECIRISRKLDINQLKYRLNHDQLNFIECSYGDYIFLKREPKKIWETSFRSIRVDSKGIIEESDLKILKMENFLEDIEGINRVEDLLGRYIGIETDVDYSELEKSVENHKNSVALRNKTLDLVMLNLLYSALPKNGYTRAKNFMRMFNKEYGLDLNMEKLDKIMSIDYSDNAQVKRLLKERRK